MDKNILKTTIKEMNKDELVQLLNKYVEISNQVKFQDILKSKTDYENLLIKNLEEDTKILENAYIKFMFNRFYKYSAIFEVDQDVFSERFKQLKDKLEETQKGTVFFDEEIENQSILMLEEQTGIKLIDERIDNSKRLSGTLISKITLDKKDYLCISTEKIPPQYRENASTSFYIKKIDGIRKWLESELLTNLLALDFEYTIQCIRKDAEETDLIVSAQSMNINGGAKATLDSTSSQVLILPILDEIKNLLEDNSELFKESQEGYKILNDYIDELEKESELPWVTLSFNKKTQVKFLFEVSTRKDYTLLNYYSGDYIKRQGREEMKNVTKTILSRYNTFSNLFSRGV